VTGGRGCAGGRPPVRPRSGGHAVDAVEPVVAIVVGAQTTHPVAAIGLVADADLLRRVQTIREPTESMNSHHSAAASRETRLPKSLIGSSMAERPTRPAHRLRAICPRRPVYFVSLRPLNEAPLNEPPVTIRRSAVSVGPLRTTSSEHAPTKVATARSRT
jgi:hypothetical protein